jgi:hypothetical protein
MISELASVHFDADAQDQVRNHSPFWRSNRTFPYKGHGKIQTQI